jgi:hypothetical protein
MNVQFCSHATAIRFPSESFDINSGIKWYTVVQGLEELGLSFFFRTLNIYNSHAELAYKDSSFDRNFSVKIKLELLGKSKKNTLYIKFKVTSTYHHHSLSL